ncbi:hypothetical protein BKA81DRAFT_25645 [Phyllosticta paracitricarpa]|uniref:Uncharacterized protein n=2 Tax=Phyllosticta TaxID=121621 RepID=A0ABR1MI86_9PEZI
MVGVAPFLVGIWPSNTTWATGRGGEGGFESEKMEKTGCRKHIEKVVVARLGRSTAALLLPTWHAGHALQFALNCQEPFSHQQPTSDEYHTTLHPCRIMIIGFVPGCDAIAAAQARRLCALPQPPLPVHSGAAVLFVAILGSGTASRSLPLCN